MRKNFKIHFKILLVFTILLGIAPLACQRNITVNPTFLIVRKPTFTPTPTSTTTPTPTTTATTTLTITLTPTFTLTFTPTSTPTVTSTFTPTETPTNTPFVIPTPPLGIYVVGGAGGTQGSPIFFAYAGLTVNLVPETTDTVVLTTPGGPQTLAYATTSGGYAIYDYFSFAGGYVPGQNYQLTVTTSIGTATSSLLTAPGNITLDPSGNFASWTVEGNADSLTVANQTPVTTYNSTSAVGPDIDSFFNIPAGAYPTTGINYTINMNAAETNAVWTGAAAGSIFLLYESASVTVSK